jgi:hypothetical protein
LEQRNWERFLQIEQYKRLSRQRNTCQHGELRTLTIAK